MHIADMTGVTAYRFKYLLALRNFIRCYVQIGQRGYTFREAALHTALCRYTQQLQVLCHQLQCFITTGCYINGPF